MRLPCTLNSKNQIHHPNFLISKIKRFQIAKQIVHVISYLALIGQVILIFTCGEATVYESELASLTFAKLSMEHYGFSGSAYVEFTSAGSLSTWEGYAPATGEYKLSIAYCSFHDAPLQAVSDGLLFEYISMPLDQKLGHLEDRNSNSQSGPRP